MQTLTIIAIFAFTMALAPLSLLFQPGQEDAPVIVVVPPWKDANKIIAAGGGRIVAPQKAPFAVLAYSEDPAFSTQVVSAGAWSVINSAALAQICGADDA
ncbi:MAG: hypothetical protein ACRBBK_04890 [Paracoccaceae bacterium]